MFSRELRWFQPRGKISYLEFLSVSVGERTIQVLLEDSISGAAQPPQA